MLLVKTYYYFDKFTDKKKVASVVLRKQRGGHFCSVVRCFNGKNRFGIHFVFPIFDRLVEKKLDR
ncbi:MAG: hypothetical protein Hyperionvirus1_33 [Hyperionvirus sp.]|uniref:Uncharacterized protein n=1 Tax=Hyperionvirus sp. TaxID=2487770 RepID=A0A3G5A7H1_9VIRU|nr:MAG: hypothetical protein Hyperionvirus1_33 [Hyperionvirus sp.]